MISTSLLLNAIVLGFLPPFIWLAFWLQEDKRRPEPRTRIVLTFIAGSLAVVLAFFLESATYSVLGQSTTLLLIAWSFIEEGLKWGATHLTALRHRNLAEEPIDAVIYLITAALGFAAAENVLFLLNPTDLGQFIELFSTGSLRFIGATVLHTFASGIMGAVIAMSFYRTKYRRAKAVVWGLVLATLLHAGFNLLIINSNGGLLGTFSLLWIAVIGLILLFEKVKQKKKPRGY